MPESDPAIIGVQSCGCITYAHARPDENGGLDASDHKALGRIVAEGGQIIRTTVGEARAMPHFLESECPHTPKGWEREPYIPPDQRITVRGSIAGSAHVYRGHKPIGHVRRDGRRSGEWYAAPGFLASDLTPEDGTRLGPFKRRQDAVDALTASTSGGSS